MNNLFRPCRIHICAAEILRHLKTSHFLPGYHNSGQCQIYLTKRRDVLAPLSTSVNRMLVVVVVLLFYVHGKHLRSCRDGQLT